jgi:hypothetical protein
MTGSVKVVGGETVEFDTKVPESLEVAREVYAREAVKRHGMAFDATTREQIPSGTYNPTERPEVIITRQFAGG